MNSKKLTLELLRNAIYPPEGLHVHIEGILYVGPEGAFINFSDEEMKIPIVEDGFERRLLNSVPCYLGSSCLYRDHVRIIATIQCVNNRVEIKEIESGSLDQDDDTYVF